jgi:hypothetical protein
MTPHCFRRISRGETKEKRAFEGPHASTLMRTMLHTLRACCSYVMLASAAANLYAQGSAFTYQGRLNDSANPANGVYDLQFTIYNSTNNPGTVVAGPLTNSAVGVGRILTLPP